MSFLSPNTFSSALALRQLIPVTNEVQFLIAQNAVSVCPSCRKSIRRDVLEGEFDMLMQSLTPSEGLLSIATKMLKDAWGQRQSQKEYTLRLIRTEHRQLEKQIEGLLDRVVESDSSTIISAYEKRIEKIERQKLVLDEKLDNSGKTLHPFEQMFEHALVFLANPWKIWESGSLLGRRTVLRLAFAERIAYSRETGLRTPKTAFPFKVLGAIHAKTFEMAERQSVCPLFFGVHLHSPPSFRTVYFQCVNSIPCH